MVQEFGYTRRSRTACWRRCRSSWSRWRRSPPGMFNGLFAALIVFPIAAIVPATPVHLDINWLVLLTLTPLACSRSAPLGLTFGTLFEPRPVPLLFGIIVHAAHVPRLHLLPVADARADQRG